MVKLDGSRTEANLRKAFASESEANGRFLYFAQRAEAEGYPDIATLFRSLAEGENNHAFGHLDYLFGGPGDEDDGASTEDNLKQSIEAETREYTEAYPLYARVAREEGFDDVADWFDTVARAERSHAGRLTAGLESLS
ncbi:MAG TPA: rubrerythrin family protein [Acidimicrobiales bacterium]|nr:rubrerythrin family protein [Acidimicrobiales bacterium]